MTTCLQCGDGISQRAKKFCSYSCSAKYNKINLNRWKGKTRPTVREIKTILCLCGKEFKGRRAKYCKDCRHEISINSGKKNRAIQLDHEQKEAKKLEDQGFKVFSPTVVCDRVAIKDGKVYFVEFKFKDQKLRDGQQAIYNLVPEMYLIQYSD